MWKRYFFAMCLSFEKNHIAKDGKISNPIFIFNNPGDAENEFDNQRKGETGI